jgi:steroid delta-isomerase-like uncharacterized protein
MAGDDLKALNKHFYDEVFGRKNLDAIDEMLTDDFVEHILAPGQAPGRQGAKQFVAQLLRAFPDLEVVVENQVAEGDTVAAVLRMTGTHQADFVGVPATGRKVSVQVMDMVRVRDNRFSEHWGLADMGGLMARLGLAPGGR